MKACAGSSPASGTNDFNGLATFKVANPFLFWGRVFQKFSIFRCFSPQAQGRYCIVQVAGGEMGITHHHGEGSMPQEIGYGLHAVPVHRQVRREGMPEIMEPEVDDPGPPTGAGKPDLNFLPWLAVLVAKNIRRFEMVSPAHLPEDLLGRARSGGPAWAPWSWCCKCKRLWDRYVPT